MDNNNIITQYELLKYIKLEKLSFRSLLSSTFKNNIIYIGRSSKPKPKIGNELIPIVYGVITKLNETKTIIFLNLTSIADEFKNNTISIILIKKSLKSLPLNYSSILTIGRLVQISNLKKKITSNLYFKFISSPLTEIIPMDIISLKSIRKNCTKENSFSTIISLLSNKLIRYQMKFLTNIITIYHIKSYYDYPHITLKAKMLIDDGTYQSMAFIENNILISFFELPSKFIDKIYHKTKKVKRCITIYDFPNKYYFKEIFHYMNNVMKNYYIIYGVPYSNCKYKIKRNEDNMFRRYTFDNRKIENKEMNLFINGDICLERKKKLIMRPFINITEIEKIN